MKKLWIVLLLATVVLMTACGVQDTISVETSGAPNTELTSGTEETATEIATTDTPFETSSEPMSSTKKNSDAKDWKTSYIDYLKTLTESSDYVSSMDNAEYAFVTMQDLKYPVLVLFSGWRDFSFFTFENGTINTAKDENGELPFAAWVDMPVYQLDGKLYFFGSSGAPATFFTREITVQNGVFMSETIASAMYASSMGNKDYFNGREGVDITENEYNATVDGIKADAEEVKFSSLKDLKG